MVKNSNALICVSGPMADQYTEVEDKSGIWVVNNGIPADELEIVDETRIRSFRRQYNLGNHLLIGVIGRIKYVRKGQEVFVAAAKILQDKHDHVKFVLVGSPFPGNETHIKNLLQLIDELGLAQEVVYTGDVEDIGFFDRHVGEHASIKF